MHKFIINGGRSLKGRVRVSGAKNAALAIIAAALLSEEEVILDNVPLISDVYIFLDILINLGVSVKWEGENTLKIFTPDKIDSITSYKEVKKLRASNLLIGPMLSRFGKSEIALPGGCKIGTRPMDLHIKGFRGLGADIVLKSGFVNGQSKGLVGNKVYLDFPSVGATENIMMAAVLAEGQTIIENVAKEPEIVDLANFLNSMGAKIRGAGTDVIKIDGVKRLKGGQYSIIPDRIEAGTYMIAAAATKGNIIIENVITKHLEPLIAKLREAQVYIKEDEDSLHIVADEKLKPIDIKTLPYPGFPTDMQSQMMALLTVVPGTSIIVENVFENRFQVADEFKRMGARIKVEGRTAIIEGTDKLCGTQVKSSDLRAGAALIIAGLVAEGETEVSNIHFIERGYEKIENKFSQLGADIRKVCL